MEIQRPAVGSGDQLIYLIDVASRSTILPLHGHIARVAAVEFTPDGRSLVSASHDGTIRVWETE